MNLHTRILMSGSALYMALLGLGASFLPQETIAWAEYPVDRPAVVLVQLTGALYLGFAFLNWMARGVLIGGIYSRPLVLGNLAHFAIATMTLLKVLTLQSPLPVLIGTGIYAVFGTWFGLVFFTHPSGKSSGTGTD